MFLFSVRPAASGPDDWGLCPSSGRARWADILSPYHAPADAHLLGEGKGDNLVSLAAKVFHRNLRNYQYVGFETLWRDPTPEEQIALKDLLIDEFVAVQAGDYLPLGYLYQGTEAYTIVEQPDGSLTLTQYALTPVEEWKQLDNPADVPLYREVSSENQMVPASVAKSLYE